MLIGRLQTLRCWDVVYVAIRKGRLLEGKKGTLRQVSRIIGIFGKKEFPVPSMDLSPIVFKVQQSFLDNKDTSIL